MKEAEDFFLLKLLQLQGLLRSYGRMITAKLLRCSRTSLRLFGLLPRI